MAQRFEYYLCGLCGTPMQEAGACPACGSDGMLIKALNGFLVEFPANSVPCPGCGSTLKPLVFRGWVRLAAFAWWTREGRAGGYVCRDCALGQTTKSLLFTAALGWWSIPSMLFYGWRATYYNWRSVWTTPARPHDWGAVSAAEFAADVRQTREQALNDAQEEWLHTESPLQFLNETQLGLVLEAEGLYELLQVDADADLDTVRRAYRQRSKEAHPDLHHASREATEAMIRLNQAWEILRSEKMRAAYDWLQVERAGTAA